MDSYVVKKGPRRDQAIIAKGYDYLTMNTYRPGIVSRSAYNETIHKLNVLKKCIPLSKRMIPVPKDKPKVDSLPTKEIKDYNVNDPLDMLDADEQTSLLSNPNYFDLEPLMIQLFQEIKKCKWEVSYTIKEFQTKMMESTKKCMLCLRVLDKDNLILMFHVDDEDTNQQYMVFVKGKYQEPNKEKSNTNKRLKINNENEYQQISGYDSSGVTLNGLVDKNIFISDLEEEYTLKSLLAVTKFYPFLYGYCQRHRELTR